MVESKEVPIYHYVNFIMEIFFLSETMLEKNGKTISHENISTHSHKIIPVSHIHPHLSKSYLYTHHRDHTQKWNYITHCTSTWVSYSLHKHTHKDRVIYRIPTDQCSTESFKLKTHYQVANFQTTHLYLPIIYMCVFSKNLLPKHVVLSLHSTTRDKCLPLKSQTTKTQEVDLKTRN